MSRGAHAARPDIAQRTEASVGWIWYDSPGFNHFRGDAWMKEPCLQLSREG